MTLQLMPFMKYGSACMLKYRQYKALPRLYISQTVIHNRRPEQQSPTRLGVDAFREMTACLRTKCLLQVVQGCTDNADITPTVCLEWPNQEVCEAHQTQVLQGKASSWPFTWAHRLQHSAADCVICRLDDVATRVPL